MIRFNSKVGKSLVMACNVLTTLQVFNLIILVLFLYSNLDYRDDAYYIGNVCLLLLGSIIALQKVLIPFVKKRTY